MSEKRYTERDIVMAKREAWLAGNYCRVPKEHEYAEVCRRYPLPKVTRPRIVRHSDYEFRVVVSGIEWRTMPPFAANPEWKSVDWIALTPSRELVLKLADLLAHPTEEVDSDE